MSIPISMDPRKFIFILNGTPVEGLSSADDAMSAALSEDLVGDPYIDLYGKGAFLENANESGVMTVKMAPTSIVGLTFLSTVVRTKVPIISAAFVDRNSPTAGVVGTACRFAGPPMWVRGKTLGETTWVLKCIELDIQHDGPSLITF